MTESNKKRARRKKYTPDYYLNLKESKNLMWKEVPFVCLECGETFYRKAIKPKTLPVNCSHGCRMDAFDGKIGGTVPPHIKELNWAKIRTLINGGRSGPEICSSLNIALTTLHKYSKKKLGVHFLKKLIENGKKRRRQGQKSFYMSKVN